MARYCANCGAQMADTAATCPSCGKAAAQAAGGGTAAAPAPAATPGTTGGMADNVAGLLAYVTIIPAIIFLVMEPYNKNRFIRFHSFQCLFLAAALFVIQVALNVIPFLGVLISLLVSLGALALWIVLLIKAYNGEMWKLPVIGDMAEKQANLV